MYPILYTNCIKVSVLVKTLIQYAPVRALDKHIKSGLIPACSQANSVPVLSKLTAISSVIT